MERTRNSISIFATMILFCFLLLPEQGRTAPSIDSVTGKVEDNTIISINGSGFGEKSPAAPLLWENFEDGQNQVQLSSSNRWLTYRGSGGIYTTDEANSGNLSVYNEVKDGDSSGEGFQTNYHVLTTPSNQLYYSYMFKHLGTNYTSGVEKLARVTASGSPYSGSGHFALSDGYVFYKQGSTYMYPADSNGSGRYFSGDEYGAAHWVRHQLYGKLSNPAGTDNGYYKVSVGSEEKEYRNVLNVLTGENLEYSQILLGLMHDEGSLPPAAHHKLFIDDVYVDNTLARVELCNSPQFDVGENCEIQIPQTWSSSGVSVSVNTGRFGNNTEVYLFVINAAGEPSPGFGPLTVGKEPDQPVLPPHNLKIEDG